MTSPNRRGTAADPEPALLSDPSRTELQDLPTPSGHISQGSQHNSAQAALRLPVTARGRTPG